MATNTRAIRSRIKSVKNTKKITKAMELVSAAKMRRAVSSVLGTRPFAVLAFETVRSVARVTDPSAHPLLMKPEGATKVLLLLITSDRGLCGGFNARMLKETMKVLSEHAAEDIRVITVGKRGADAIRRAGREILASFVDLSNTPRYESIRPISRLILDEFRTGAYAKIVLAYTDYITALTQKPNVMTLLPLAISETTPDPSLPVRRGEVAPTEYTFEPNPIEVLDALLPKIVETKIWQALLESSASEHSARMLSMRNASEAATDMISSLTFTFNQARQAGITREIAEIASGKAALE